MVHAELTCTSKYIILKQVDRFTSFLLKGHIYHDFSQYKQILVLDTEMILIMWTDLFTLQLFNMVSVWIECFNCVETNPARQVGWDISIRVNFRLVLILQGAIVVKHIKEMSLVKKSLQSITTRHTHQDALCCVTTRPTLIRETLQCETFAHNRSKVRRVTQKLA